MKVPSAGNTKTRLASQSATEQKFELLGVDTKEDVNDCGAEFAIVDLSAVSRVRQESSDAFKGLRQGVQALALCAKLVLEAPVACANGVSMP